MRNTAAKLTFLILTFNVTFINKNYGDTKRRYAIYNQAKAQSSKCAVALNQSIFGLSYELGVNGMKKLKETGILLIKMDKTHFTLVNLEVLAV